MTALATVSYDKESPSRKLARLIGEGVLRYVRAHPVCWPKEARHVAHACIRYLAYGEESEAAARHLDRFIRLDRTQSDIIVCCYSEITLEHADLVELAHLEAHLWHVAEHP